MPYIANGTVTVIDTDIDKIDAAFRFDKGYQNRPNPIYLYKGIVGTDMKC